MKMIMKTVYAALLLNPIAALAIVVVDFDVATQMTGTSYGAIQGTSVAFNENTPILPAGSSGYTGVDVYGGFHEIGTAGAWGVSDSSGSGARLRFNSTSGSALNLAGLYLFKTPGVRFEAANDTLSASGIYITKIDRLAAASIRFVVEDNGSYYISDETALPLDTPNGLGGRAYSASVEALGAGWSTYEPRTSSAGVATIGPPVSTPAFTNIGFIGFALFGESTATQSGLNFGAKTFQATATDGGGTGSVLIAPDDPNLVFEGSHYITVDPAGVFFQRHSDAVLALTDAEKGFNTKRAKTTTGISMWFKTDSPSVTVRFSHDLSGTVENRGSRFGVYENGTFVSSHDFANTVAALDFTITSASPGVASVFRVVLPNWAKPDFLGLELDSGSSLSAYTPPSRKKYVVMGDSISHGTGQGSSYQTYPWIVAELLNLELCNLAVGGSQVSLPAAEMLAEFPPVDVISILIGYNDLQSGGKTPAQFETDLNAMLDAVRANQPDAELFCISPLFTTNPTNAATGETIQDFRQVVYDAVSDRQLSGDALIHLIRGEDITSAADLNDVVHLSEAGAASFATNLFLQMDPIVTSPKPNILFIAIDDINPIMGCYGNTLIQTPEMDGLASRGMLFENAHCQASICSASRASLMTGLMPEQTGVFFFDKMRGDAVDDSRDNAKGLTNLVTIPQHFISHGYATAGVGKINDYRCVGSINPDGTINEDGAQVDDPPSWSYSFANPSGVGGTSAVRTTDAKTVKLAAERVNQPATSFTDGLAATEAINVMTALAAGNQPFFLGVGFKKPHLPFLAPESSWSLYDAADFTPEAFQSDMLNATTEYMDRLTIQELRNSYYLETNGSGQALPFTTGTLPVDQQQLLLHGYYASISHIDEQVGRVLDQLDALGLTSNTVVVLWGDHGFHLGDHNKWGKHTHLEQASRMPLIISAPGFPQDVTTRAPAGLIDLYPTLCELAGLPLPEQPISHAVSTGRPLVGKSLVPVLTDPDARVQTGVMNQWGTSTYAYAYRTERYRFTEWINSSGTVVSRELYDYELDPLETVNLAVYPEYNALMYQYSKAMRTADEAGGCDRLKGSTGLSLPAEKSLVGLKISGTQVSYPDAVGTTYNLMSTTNLVDGTWVISQSGLPASPAGIVPVEDQEFYRVEVVD